jgi:hypothetical protein
MLTAETAKILVLLILHFIGDKSKHNPRAVTHHYILSYAVVFTFMRSWQEYCVTDYIDKAGIMIEALQAVWKKFTESH